jgi:hypothetical protein
MLLTAQWFSVELPLLSTQFHAWQCPVPRPQPSGTHCEGAPLKLHVVVGT